MYYMCTHVYTSVFTAANSGASSETLDDPLRFYPAELAKENYDANYRNVLIKEQFELRRKGDRWQLVNCIPSNAHVILSYPLLTPAWQ